MFPPTHPAVAYLLYTAITHNLEDAPPRAAPTLALVVGALLPDLVDQPLYHLFALPSTRTFAHSLLVAVPVCLLVAFVVRRSSLPDAVASGFVVGYLSHPAADALWPFVLGKYDELGFLLWPITHSPAYEGTKPLVAVGDVTVTTLWVELPLLAAGLFVWWRDGAPGLEALRDRLPVG